MTAERWERIGELFHQALERSAGERDALLADACAGDTGLRASVEALLLAHCTGLPLLDDGLAALVPSVVAACGRFGNASQRGDFGTGVIEYKNGIALISMINAETLLAIIVRANANIGQLLYELRRHRTASFRCSNCS